MAIYVKSLWARICGLFITTLCVFSHKAESAELGYYPFTPEAKSPCNYTTKPSGCVSPNPNPSNICTKTFYNGLPYFCYDELTVSRGKAYYLPPISGMPWNCSSEQNNGTIKYQNCNRVNGYGTVGWRRSKDSGYSSSGPYTGVEAYGFSYETAARIIGCVDSSKNLKGAYTGQYYNGNLSSITCTDAIYCPLDEFNFIPGPFPTGPTSNINHCYVKDNSVGKDATGTFTYELPPGNNYCKCFYNNEYQCGSS